MTLITLDGEISIPRTFDFDELRRFPDQVSERATSLGGREIVGIPLSALIDALRVKSWARFALVYGAGDRVANIAVESIERCMIIYAIGARPLWADLGGPVRLIADGLGRHADVRGVERISFSILPATIDHPFERERTRAVTAHFRS